MHSQRLEHRVAAMLCYGTVVPYVLISRGDTLDLLSVAEATEISLEVFPLPTTNPNCTFSRRLAH